MTAMSDAASLYVGLMSGTSMDGIDAALVEFESRACRILTTESYIYPGELRAELLKASRSPSECTIDRIGCLDRWVGERFRDAANDLIAKSKVDRASIVAVGSHGQTLRHQPRAERPFTMQIGDPNAIASGTSITTVADFRRRDMAVGGEGAPLTPAFHRWLFSDVSRSRCVLNLGGIANVTVIPKDNQQVVGLDTGPANTLLDAWAQKNLGVAFDKNGDLANSGKVSDGLLQVMLEDPYFSEPPPKSTGFEYFNHAWINAKLSNCSDDSLTTGDVQATLAELTAATIAKSISQWGAGAAEVLVCGGGIHNSDLMSRLRDNMPNVLVDSTEREGLPPDWVEAVAFAWFAKQCIERKTGNIPAVTGASREVVLGAIYCGER